MTDITRLKTFGIQILKTILTQKLEGYSVLAL